MDLNQALQSMAERKLLKYAPSSILVMVDGSTAKESEGTVYTHDAGKAEKEDETKKDPEDAMEKVRRRRGVIRSFKKGEGKEK